MFLTIVTTVLIVVAKELKTIPNVFPIVVWETTNTYQKSSLMPYRRILYNYLNGRSRLKKIFFK